MGGGQQKAAPAPRVVYQGPSEADIAQNRAALDQYRMQMTQQQDLFKAQLQSQIDAANAETARLKQQYDAEAAAATAAASAQQQSAYTVSTKQSEPVNAQTTAAIVKKDKTKSGLKITTAGLPSTSGTGLNIGV
jgi:multidrug resistance efflux pump